MSVWLRIPDFNELSWNGRAVCFTCGSTKRDTEEAVFRPQAMDDFSGFPDLCEGCIVEAASQIGMVESDVAVQAQEGNLRMRDALASVGEELTAARSALATVTRENVRLQDDIEEMILAVEEPYSGEMLGDLEDD